MLAGGCQGLADSRWENLRRLREAGITAPLMLIRTPALSEVEAVVRWADLSVNTEPVVLKALDQAAGKAHTRHRIILMVEAGDLREGKELAELLDLVDLCQSLPNLELAGIGCNMGCLSTSGPSATSQGILQQAVALVEGRLEKKLAIVSGGNSGLLYREGLLTLSAAVTQVRVGEALLLGKDPVEEQFLPTLRQDGFVLEAEVIEVGTKQSPEGDGAVGQTQVVSALGRQDLGAGSLVVPEDMVLLGVSSDHLVLRWMGGDGASSQRMPPRVGERVKFLPDYEALVGLMTSPFVTKTFVKA